jgi:hypothetical protein
MDEQETNRQMRIGSEVRGLFITVLIGGYAWFFNQPGASLTKLFLIGAVLQAVVIAMRKWFPIAALPFAMYVFELLVDGATVLLFALGVFGGIFRMAESV